MNTSHPSQKPIPHIYCPRADSRVMTRTIPSSGRVRPTRVLQVDTVRIGPRQRLRRLNPWRPMGGKWPWWSKKCVDTEVIVIENEWKMSGRMLRELFEGAQSPHCLLINCLEKQSFSHLLIQSHTGPRLSIGSVRSWCRGGDRCLKFPDFSDRCIQGLLEPTPR